MEYYYGRKEPQNKQLIWIFPKSQGRCQALKYGSRGWKPIANTDAIDDIYSKIVQIDTELLNSMSLIQGIYVDENTFKDLEGNVLQLAPNYMYYDLQTTNLYIYSEGKLKGITATSSEYLIWNE